MDARVGRVREREPQRAVDTDPALDDMLAAWRIEGSLLIDEQRGELEQAIAAIAPQIEKRRYAKAAALAQIAANYAVFWHTGTFASADLEAAVRTIGERALPDTSPRPAAVAHRRILHVATQVGGIGGHVRMMWRWIRHDPSNVHSVALTRQTRALPQPLAAAVAASSGKVHLVNRVVGGLLQWAKALQVRFANADLVVLHVHGQDVVPFLALAGMASPPPVVFVNHADHVFWLGASFCDFVCSSRITGHTLCTERRGIHRERAAMLPICLELSPRGMDREAAKRALGLPEDSLVLLSIARGLKYRTVGGATFADAFTPILAAYPHAHLVVLGPKGTVDWSAAERRAPGRIHVHPERPDTRTFLDAADIYVDSYPFASITSLFEAGLSELPLVTRFPFGANCGVLGGDSIGLDSILLRCRSCEELHERLHRLIRNETLRREIGSATRLSIEDTNVGEAWTRALRRIYWQVDSLPPRSPVPFGHSPARRNDVDLFLPFACGPVLPRYSHRARYGLARETGLKTLPPLARLASWADMAAHGDFAFRSRAQSWRYLVPEWITARFVEA